MRQSKQQRWGKPNNPGPSLLQCTDPKADALWKPSASMPCSCSDIQHGRAEERPPAAWGRGHPTTPPSLLPAQGNCKHTDDAARESCWLMAQGSQGLHRDLPPKERVRIKGDRSAFAGGRSSRVTKDHLRQQGCSPAAGLTRAAVIKPLDEQIRGLFTKPAPVITLFDQLQNSLW